MDDERIGKISYWGIVCGPHQRRMARLRVDLSRLIVCRGLMNEDTDLKDLPVILKSAIIAAEQMTLAECLTETTGDGAEERTYRWLDRCARGGDDVERLNQMASIYVGRLMVGRKH